MDEATGKVLTTTMHDINTPIMDTLRSSVHRQRQRCAAQQRGAKGIGEPAIIPLRCHAMRFTIIGITDESLPYTDKFWTAYEGPSVNSL